MTSRTGRFRKNEVRQSPVSIDVSQWKYWTHSRLVEAPAVDDGVPGGLAHVNVEGERLHRATGHGLHADEQERRDQEETSE